jgi:hypothetical protein
MVGVGKVREQGRKVDTIKDKFDRFDCDISLNQPCPFIFIGWGGLAPQGNPFTSLIYQDSSIWLGIGRHRSDRCTRRADLAKVVSPPSRLRLGRSTYES